MASANPPETVRPSMLVPITALTPSKTNPRTRFNEDSLKELAASMAPPVGIIEPLVVRPNGAIGSYEIVAGERRYRAAKIAGLTVVPVIVRDLTDVQVLDLQLIENKHRDDIHPLDEAHAMERRIKLDRQLTPKGMAKFIGVSERYVQNRLRYLTMLPELQKRFLEGRFSAGHADLLIRLSTDDQKFVLKQDALFSDLIDAGNDGYFSGGKEKRLRSVRELDEWIKENIRLKIEEAAQSGMFPEIADALQEGVVTGYGPPIDEKTGKRVDAPLLLEVVDGYGDVEVKKGETAPLDQRHWKEVKKGDKCEHQQRAVMVMGHDRGRILSVCIAKKECQKHWPAAQFRSDAYARPKPPKPSKQQLEEQQNRQLWETAQKPVFAAFRKAAQKLKPTAAVLKLVARPYEKWKTFGDFVASELENNVVFNLEEARKAAKVLGVDLKPILAAAAPKEVEPKKAVKKAAKKTAGGRKKK